MPKKNSESAEMEAPVPSAAKQGKKATAKQGGAAAGKATTKKAGAADGQGRTRKAAAPAKTGPDLRQDLRDFAAARPEGWSHDDWLAFLDHLQQRGHNINDRDQIGAMLERERLALALEKVPGVGPQRVQTIADRYGYIWRLREADPDEVAREANIPRSLAERVVEAVRG